MNTSKIKKLAPVGTENMHKDVFIAFIDVLGMREFSSHTAGLYANRIVEFQKALYENRKYLKNGTKNNEGHVYIYSDCAFMYSRSVIDLISYLIQVRKSALTRGNGVDHEPLFFKAAIVRGDFGLIKVSQLNFDSKMGATSQDNTPNDNIVEGISFSEKAVEVYLTHERSKAIGIWISDAAINESVNKYVVKNMHFPPDCHDGPEVFTDIRFSPEELKEHNILINILRAFFKAKVKSKKFEKYYIPILCNWVQSLDMESLTRKMSSKEKANLQALKEEEGYILYLVVSGYFEKDFRSVRGLGYFYLAVLNHIYESFFIDHDKKNLKSGVSIPKPLDKIEHYLLGLKRVQNAIPTMPETFMGPLAKDILLNRLTRHQ